MTSPAVFTSAIAVTPSDSATLRGVVGLYIGVAGDVAVLMTNDPAITAAVTFKNVPAGTVLHVRAKKVMLTGTTAASILALR